MKIKFITNKIGFDIQDDIDKVVAFIEEKTPLKVEYDVEEVNITTEYSYFFKNDFDNKMWFGTKKTKDKIRPVVQEGEYHAVCYIHDKDHSFFMEVDPEEKMYILASWSFWKPIYPDTEYTEVATTKAIDGRDWTWKLIAHELLHSFVKRAQRRGRNVNDEMDRTIVKGKEVAYFHNDDPYHKDGNFARTIANLSDHWDMVEYFPKAWKYFSPTEKTGSSGTVGDLQTILVDKIDTARGIAGIPFSITSGFRTADHNKRVGGSTNSAHLRGYAVDLRVRNDDERDKILSALRQVGFNRIGISETFVHADCDPSLPAGKTWLY